MELLRALYQSQNLFESLKIDGVDQECHAAQFDGNSATAKCWIASQAGKEFSVNHTYFGSEILTYVVFLTVDGKDAGNRIINHPARTQDLTILSISDIRVSHNAVRPLRFWNVRLIDDEQQDSELFPNRVVNHSTIVLSVRHVYLEDPVTSPAGAVSALAGFVGAPTISDRALKGLGPVHGVDLGQGRPIPPMPAYRGTVSKGIACFVFRYTSKDMLIAQGIIPRPVPIVAPASGRPTPLPAPSPSSATEPAEESKNVEQLEDRLRTVEAAVKKMEAMERTGAVKREQSASPEIVITDWVKNGQKPRRV
ncbi:hypothetical protein BDV98DRAFT_606869 [Pterulicium gracile]|uniref:DUF7918 domain-containing protein n=1 Tax=Pterulicium gracile TaxID=1884261 RepID=A0A5C3Q9P2_9AGAR|nr:hypothetical protein BDV98DRAFT_606869 [Pterula gracilis]